MTLAARTLADDVWALLQAVPNINHFRGRVVIPTRDPAKPATLAYWDDDRAVHAYTVLYASAGQALTNRLGSGASGLAWTFQVTCVGGDDIRALWCVDTVRAAFTGRRLRNGRLRELGDPGPVRRDDDETPPRYYLPLTFAVYATA